MTQDIGGAGNTKFKMPMTAPPPEYEPPEKLSGQGRKARAAIVTGLNEPLVVEEVYMRPLRHNEVFVRMEATSVCVTDSRAALGLSFVKPPMIPGHAGCGIVEEVGTSVTRVKPGQRVVFAASPECGDCFYCVNDQPAFCEQMLALQSPPRVVATRADGTPLGCDVGLGCFSEYVNARDISCTVVEADVAPEHLATLGCGCTTGLGCIFNLGEVKPGSSVGVLGCGQCGLWMIQGARAAGAATIIAVDPIAERRAVAKALGATHVLDPTACDVIDEIFALTNGRGVDYGFEAAGPPSAIEQGFAMTRYCGTFVPIGMTPDVFAETVTFPAVTFVGGSKRIHACNYGGAHSKRDIPRFANMMEKGVVDPRPIVTDRFSLDQINEVFEKVNAYALVGSAILYPPK